MVATKEKMKGLKKADNLAQNKVALKENSAVAVKVGSHFDLKDFE
jgi:hypothetical protein